jgi:dihydrofolate reductase
MATEVIAYVAMSLDGYIAGDGGTVGFLEDYGSEEYDFHGFFDSVGALVMGSATYEQVLGFGWPYGDIPCLVLTSRDLDVAEGATITFSSEPTAGAIREYAKTTDKRLWIVGGGKVITEGLIKGAIDTLELYVMPTALGSGVPLFSEPYDGTLTVSDQQTYSNGVVKLVYATG